jgi:uncharacterized protein (TIGR02118 family)
LKLVFCLHRRPGLSREEFHEYWKDTHAPLVRRCAEALGIQRYVQLHTREDPLNDVLQASRGAPEAFDGIAELWWKSREALEEALSTAEGQEAGRILLEDERRFIDLSRSPIWLAHEHEIAPGSDSPPGA